MSRLERTRGHPAMRRASPKGWCCVSTCSSGRVCQAGRVGRTEPDPPKARRQITSADGGGKTYNLVPLPQVATEGSIH